MTRVNPELAAWRWLLKLPRLNFRKVGIQRYDKQIRISACPGKLHDGKGEPHVVVTYEHPDRLGQRFRGSGNSLYDACERLHRELDREVGPETLSGIQLLTLQLT